MDSNYLQHYGVLGMKWGIRRFQNKDGTLTSAGKKRYENYHEDYKKSHTKKSVKEMSDKELKDRVNRLQMEKQYKQLSKEDINKGKTFVNKLIKTGTTVATVTGTALTIYSNLDKIRKIIENNRQES